MKQPPEDILPIMTLAADLRAAGNSWDAIAVKVEREPRTCRGWPVRYPEVWQRLYDEAVDRFLEEAGDEATFYLRRLLRASDPKDPWLQQNTAKFLATQRREARRERRAAAAQAGPPGDWTPYLSYLETLSDAQLKAFVDEFVARRQAQAGAAVPVGDGEPGPAVGG
jgi:predicted Zn-dependent protease